jgi:hypothetical protein
MNEIDARYAAFCLTEENRQRLVDLPKPAPSLPASSSFRVVVETIIVQHGDRTVVCSEEHSV